MNYNNKMKAIRTYARLISRYDRIIPIIAPRPHSHNLDSRRRLLQVTQISRGIATTALQLGEDEVSTQSPSTSPISSKIEPPTVPLEPLSLRRQSIKQAKSFSEFLTDTFDRKHTYLRISITERCNLRCLYCMPEEGVPLSPNSHLLTTPEILHLAEVFVRQGVNKIRLTGGEPTIRKDIVELVSGLGKLKSKGLNELAITSNGLILHRKLEKLVEGGLTAVNLSLDTLDPFKFEIMTRRKGSDNVLKSMKMCLEMGIRPVKVNCVVMKGLNDGEVIDFVEMTREKEIEVRFIEYMPFDGNKWNLNKMVSYSDLLSIIRSHYPSLSKVPDISGHENDTSKTYQVSGFKGKIGFITSMTHNFCGTCNRLRITSDGNLKVCLFGNKEVSLRDMLRSDEIRKGIVSGNIGEIGIAEQCVIENSKKEMERDLLDVIGKAVKGKKEKHAGIGELEKMKNRPMILIDELPFTSLSRPSHSSTFRKAPFTRLLFAPSLYSSQFTRVYSTKTHDSKEQEQRLTHLTPSTATAHIISVTSKPTTTRLATASGFISFSNPLPSSLIAKNLLKKGDVLSVARIAAIMAAKKTSEIIPLCHNVGIEGVVVDVLLIGVGTSASGFTEETTLEVIKGQQKQQEEKEKEKEKEHVYSNGAVKITATVTTTAKTGVEMEAMTAVMGGLLTVYDMCKSVDKGMTIGQVEVLEKKGGRSGEWKRGERETLEK